MRTPTLIASAISLALLGFSQFACAKQSQPACEAPLVSPQISDGQAAFDDYSWRTFIALNWPASTTQRGKPDCSKSLGDDTPVWQTFKTSTRVFLADADNPGEWNAGYGTVNAAHPLMQLSKASNADALDSHNEAVGGWLIDQNGNPTYFQMWVNQTWYDYVVSNQFYNKDNFSNNTRIDLPNNAIEVKSAWRMLTRSDEASDYVTQQSTVALFNTKGEPTGQFKTVTLGLVGLHLIVKAPGFPQWIWATFEHVDNVPDSEYNPKTYTVKPQPVQGVNYSYFNANAGNPNQSPCQAGDPSNCLPFSTPNPLTRLTPIRDQAAQKNTQYQTSDLIKNTVFRNYQLITTQWPSMPNNPAVTNGMPTPTISANTTMESYIQSSSNCMNCHGMAVLPGTAVKSDFSFLFSAAQSASDATANQ